MTRTELYKLIDDTAKSFNPCFCQHTTRKYLKMFAESHWEAFAYRLGIDELESTDPKTYEQYKNRYLKRVVEINMEYIEMLKARPQPKEVKVTSEPKRRKKK